MLIDFDKRLLTPLSFDVLIWNKKGNVINLSVLPLENNNFTTFFKKILDQGFWDFLDTCSAFSAAWKKKFA